MAATVLSVVQVGRSEVDGGLGREICPFLCRDDGHEAYAAHGGAGLQRRPNLSTGLLKADSYGTQPSNLRLLHLVYQDSQQCIPWNNAT